MDVDRTELARYTFESDHQVNLSAMKIVDREPNWKKRMVKEALWTRKFNSFNHTKHSLRTSCSGVSFP